MGGRAGILVWAWCGLLLALAGCATPRSPAAPAGAAGRAAVPAGMRRYPLALGAVSSGGTPLRRVAPVYPPPLLERCPPPQEVSARLRVDTAGKVIGVQLATAAPADADRRALVAAVREAALQWRFTPLEVSHWAADAEGNSHGVDSATTPFSVTYVFRFECRGGQPIVSSSASPP